MSSLSHSRAYVFTKCRKQYDYKYRKNIKTLPKNLYLDSWERMNRGILIHAGMESGFLGEPVYQGINEHIEELQKQVLSDEQKAMLPGMAQDSIAVACAALEWLPVTDWEPVIHNGKPMVEAELRMPIAGWEDYVGYADLVARHKPTGRVLVLDYKSRERFEAAESDRFNKQFALYQYVLGFLGVHCDGSLLVELKPTPPRRAVRGGNVDIGGIDSERISACGRFRSIPTYRSQTFLENTWRNFEREAKVMAYVGDEEIFTNMNAFVCKDCPYQRLCQAELNGEDADYILRTQYQRPGSIKVVCE
jgi:hypothetical protein